MHRLDALRTARSSAGLSVTQLATKANVSEHYINRGEAVDNAAKVGNPFPTAESVRIAAALGVSLTTLGKVDV